MTRRHLCNHLPSENPPRRCGRSRAHRSPLGLRVFVLPRKGCTCPSHLSRTAAVSSPHFTLTLGTTIVTQAEYHLAYVYSISPGIVCAPHPYPRRHSQADRSRVTHQHLLQRPRLRPSVGMSSMGSPSSTRPLPPRDSMDNKLSELSFHADDPLSDNGRPSVEVGVDTMLPPPPPLDAVSEGCCDNNGHPMSSPLALLLLSALCCGRVGPYRADAQNSVHSLAQRGDNAGLAALLRSDPSTDLDARDSQNVTALHWAAINAHIATCRFLLDSGAEVDPIGGDLMATPLQWAARNGHLYVVHLLLSRGADPNLKDTQGFNTLHLITHSSAVMPVLYMVRRSYGGWMMLIVVASTHCNRREGHGWAYGAHVGRVPG